MVSVPIVDAHVHLYDTRRFPYAWMNDVPKLNRPHLPADFHSAVGKAPVDQIVFVEVWVDKPHQMAEAEWVDIVEWTMSGSSESEMRKLFRDNAIAFYRLPQMGD